MGESHLNIIHSPSKRQSLVGYYVIAFVLRLIISSVFIDQNDGPVFLQTAEDVLQGGKILYYEGSLQNRFNYFPIDYLFILPGMVIYYMLNLDNAILARVFLRIPVNIADLVLAYTLRYYLQHVAKSNFSEPEMKKYELLVLFSPILIYSGAYKGQLDVFVAFMVLCSMIFLQTENFVLSGIFSALSVLSKPYAVIVSFYVFVYLQRLEIKSSISFVIGNIIGVIPVLGIGLLFNFEGMINHAILFHLDRSPDGFSLIGLLLDVIREISYFSDINIDDLSKLLTIISTSLLILLLLFIFYLLIHSEPSFNNLLKYIIAGLLSFFLFNKVFWLQYVCLLFLVFLLYQIEQDQVIHTAWINWSLNVLPLFLIMRCAFFVPEDVQQYLGEPWYEIIWILGLSLHFLILGIQLQQRKDLFITPRKIIYYVLVLCLWLMSYFYIKITYL